jgi:hypothetical protein
VGSSVGQWAVGRSGGVYPAMSVHLKIKSTPRLAKSYLQQISVCKLIRKTYIHILLDQRQSWR